MLLVVAKYWHSTLMVTSHNDTFDLREYQLCLLVLILQYAYRSLYEAAQAVQGR